MKAIALVGMMVTMLLVLYLTVTSLKTKHTLPALQDSTGNLAPATLTEIPAEVKGKLNEAVERGQAERKAVEDLEK